MCYNILEIMTYELPQKYSLVDLENIPAEDWLRILDEVVATVDPNDVEPYPYLVTEVASSLNSGPTEPDRMGLGVLDDEGRLVAFTSATIDEDDRHATVDTLVVLRSDRGPGNRQGFSKHRLGHARHTRR